MALNSVSLLSRLGTHWEETGLGTRATGSQSREVSPPLSIRGALLRGNKEGVLLSKGLLGWHGFPALSHLRAADPERQLQETPAWPLKTTTSAGAML